MLITYLIAFLVIQTINAQPPTQPYLGTYIGKFQNHLHGVTGDLYAVDENTIYIQNFNYDGQGPDAYFWMGSTTKPDGTGIIIPDEKGSTKPLGEYKNKNLVLRLPEGKRIRDIKWISVWCRKFNANFGDMYIPRRLEVPSPVEIAPLSQLDHGVKSGPITIVDAQTFLIPDFHYDGQGPAGYWWATRGRKQGPSGTHLNDENGTQKALRRYSGETVVISLPDGKTIWDYDFLGIWCEQFNVDFGHTRIPQNVKVPPSPRMLGIMPETKLNCEVLHEGLGLEVRWVMDGDDVVIQLVGKIAPGEYMAFGLGKEDSKSDMINADATVTWFDRQTGKGHAVDYFLESKQQCVGNRGSCPDVKFNGGTESNSLLHAAVVDQYTMITYKRPQLGVDDKYDQHVYSDGQQAVLWAVGPVNNRNEVSYHRLRSAGNRLLDFARNPQWNCPNPDQRPVESNEKVGSAYATPQPRPQSQPTIPAARTINQPTNVATTVASPVAPKSTSSSSSDVWEIPPVICPVDNVFRAQIGPTGGKKGYEGITGRVGWGISWYINGLLIPELTVQRGRTYTFIVEGGNDAENSARRHPLYITDSEEGGFEHKTKEERKRERIFAGVGVTNRGELIPTAEGRLCSWKIDTRQKEQPDQFKDFFSFQRTLNLECQPGEPGFLQWTPDFNTPDTVYYQCFTHRYLGWKIRVVDSCDYLASSSIESPQLMPVHQNVSLSVPKKFKKIKQVQSRPVIPPKQQQQQARSIQQKPKQPQYQRQHWRLQQLPRQQLHQPHQHQSNQHQPKNKIKLPNPNEQIFLQPISLNNAHRFESTRLSAQMIPTPFIPEPFLPPMESYLPPMFNTDTIEKRSKFIPPENTRLRKKEHIASANVQREFRVQNRSAVFAKSFEEQPKKVTSYKENSFYVVNKNRNQRRKINQTKPIVTLPKQNHRQQARQSFSQNAPKQLKKSFNYRTTTTTSPTTAATVTAVNTEAATFASTEINIPQDEIRRQPPPMNNKKPSIEIIDFKTPELTTIPAKKKSLPLITITSNGTDNAILSHIMSLIAENAVPPEVKISSERLGSQASTHVEIHHKSLVKRSTNKENNNQYQNVDIGAAIKATSSNVHSFAYSFKYSSLFPLFIICSLKFILF